MSQAERTQALRAFLEGDLREWTGLPAGCERADAEAAFGSSGDGPDTIGRIGGHLAAHRRYPAGGIAPHGVTVWLAGDQVAHIQIDQPVLLRPLEDILGPPETRHRSLLRTRHTQLIYASRGVIAHVHNVRSGVFRLYGTRTTTVEEFLKSALSRVSSRRIPLRR